MTILPYCGMIIVLVGTLLVGCSAKEPWLTPQREYVAAPSETIEVPVRVVCPSPRTPWDIVLLIDTTESMQNVLEDIKHQGRQFVDEIRMFNPHVRFALAWYADDPEPWGVAQGFTSDPVALGRALRQLAEHSGGEDLPERLSLAVAGMHTLSWNPAAQRLVIVFGDAPPKDPDPGLDGRVKTSDDLIFREVVASLAREEITVLALYDPTRSGGMKGLADEAERAFISMAEATGGKAYPLLVSGELQKTTTSLVHEQWYPLSEVTIADDFRPWLVDITPETRDLAGGVVLARLRPPDNMQNGTYRISFTAPQTLEGAPCWIQPTTVNLRVDPMHTWLTWLPLAAVVLVFSTTWLQALGRRHSYVCYEQNPGPKVVATLKLLILLLAIGWFAVHWWAATLN